jgi:hypothetical protein
MGFRRRRFELQGEFCAGRDDTAVAYEDDGTRLSGTLKARNICREFRSYHTTRNGQSQKLPQ